MNRLTVSNRAKFHFSRNQGQALPELSLKEGDVGRCFSNPFFFLMAVSEYNSVSAVDWSHLQAQHVTNLNLIPDRPLVTAQPRKGLLTSLGLVLSLI